MVYYFKKLFRITKFELFAKLVKEPEFHPRLICYANKIIIQ